MLDKSRRQKFVENFVHIYLERWQYNLKLHTGTDYVMNNPHSTIRLTALTLAETVWEIENLGGE